MDRADRCYKYFRGIIAFYQFPPQMMEHQTKGSILLYRQPGNYLSLQIGAIFTIIHVLLSGWEHLSSMRRRRIHFNGVSQTSFAWLLGVICRGCPLVILARQFVRCQVALDHTRDEGGQTEL